MRTKASAAVEVDALPSLAPDVASGGHVVAAVNGRCLQLPVSLCTMAMNSCGSAWTTLGVISYTITGPAAPAWPPTRGFLDGRVDRLSGCGLGPWRPPALFGLDNVDDMACVLCLCCGLSLQADARRR